MTADRTRLSCDEVSELAGLFVLDALDADERAVVAHHLATCSASAHEEFAQLGAAVPALASVPGPLSAPAALKARVLEAYRAETTPAPVARPRPLAQRSEPRSWLRMPAFAQLAPLAAALVLVAVVGAWGLTARAEADRANRRATELSNAIAAMTAPGSAVAILHGSGTAAGANGFAAFPLEGGVHVVLSDVPSAPADKSYQAWYIVDGSPTSAGLLAVGSDGYVVTSFSNPLPGTQVFAVTLEPVGGSTAPTSDPIVVGQVATPG